MSATGSTGIGRNGPLKKGRRRAAPNSPAPVVMQRVPSVGSKAHLWYDPVTGRRLERVKKEPA